MTRPLTALLLSILLSSLSATLPARTIRVPQDSLTIQAGIDGAEDGDTVLVAPGVYTGEGNRDIQLLGKAVVVISEAGPELTTIDVKDEDMRGINLNQQEPADAMVSGFRVIRASIGIYCSSGATIKNCIMENNRQGLYLGNSTARVRRCIIRNNDGSENPIGTAGAGIRTNSNNSGSTVENCLIVNNKTNNIGGGIYVTEQSPSFINCTVAGNSAQGGGGIYASDGAFLRLRNCILWDNQAMQFPNLRVITFDITYSNIEGSFCWPGPGNISIPPAFKDDLFHLAGASPGVDAGDPTSNYLAEPEPNGTRINMGAYGNTPDATPGFSDKAVIRRLSPDAGPPAGGTNVSIVGRRFGDAGGQVTFDGIPATINSWSDALVSCKAPKHASGKVTIQVSPAGGMSDSLTFGYTYTGRATLRVPSSLSTIQEAIYCARDGDTVLVAPGIYTGTGNREIDLLGKAVVVTSEAGPEETVIDCQGEEVEGFKIDREEGANTVIQGFRIINGRFGIYSEASPTINNCHIENHTEAGVMWRAYNGDNASGVLKNCNISGNQAKGVVTYATRFGEASPTIENNVIEKNIDGAIYVRASNIFSFFYFGPYVNNATSRPKIRNNIIRDNQGFAVECYAAGDWYQNVSFRATASPVIANNLVINNQQSLSAKAAFDGPDGISWRSFVEPVISNCTFQNNGFLDIISTDSAKVTVHNSIFWDGQPSEIKLETGGAITSMHSNYDNPQPDLGPGNISTDPKFVNPEAGDFRIFADSPCIDSGDNGLVSSNADFFGNNRISDGDGDGTATVDMGLFEYALPQIMQSPADRSVCEGERVELAVQARGENLTFQWTRNDTPITGATEPQLTLSEVSLSDQGTYICIISDDLGGIIQSIPATLTVTALKLLEATIRASETEICEGEQVTFNLEATNAGDNPSIRWQVNGQEINLNDFSFHTSSLQDGDQIRSIVQASAACLADNPDTSNVLSMRVYPLPPVELDPFDTVSLHDEPFELTAGSPSGGTYEGPGVTDNIFDPAEAGLGAHTITYTFTDNFGCTDSASGVIVVDQMTGFNAPVQNAALNVYPNPSTGGRFTLSITGVDGRFEVAVFDSRGIMIHRYFQLFFSEEGAASTTVELGHLPAGVFFLRLKNEEGIFTKTISIVK